MTNFTVLSFTGEFCVFTGTGAGMFSVFSHALALIQTYEDGLIQGAKIDFGKSGCYYFEEYGPNWWEYYFDPINLGTCEESTLREGVVFYNDHLRIIEKNTREENYALIEKYIHIKPHVQSKIDSFLSTHFSKDLYMIGVHYRGTDKRDEAERVPYEHVLQAIYEHIAGLGGRAYKIFLATDENPFLEFLLSYFPNELCYTSAMRSKDMNHPLHYANQDHRNRQPDWYLREIPDEEPPKKNPYQVGEEALIDCVLLSKTDALIKTPSNLSDFSSFFNPKIPVIKLYAQSD